MRKAKKSPLLIPVGGKNYLSPEGLQMSEKVLAEALSKAPDWKSARPGRLDAIVKVKDHLYALEFKTAPPRPIPAPIDGIVEIEGQKYAMQIKADPSFGIRWRQLGRNRKVESRVKFFNSGKARDRFVKRLFGNPSFLLIDSQFEGDR